VGTTRIPRSNASVGGAFASKERQGDAGQFQRKTLSADKLGPKAIITKPKEIGRAELRREAALDSLVHKPITTFVVDAKKSETCFEPQSQSFMS